MNYGLILLIMTAIAFLVPFIYQSHLSRKHDKWKENEAKSIIKEGKGKSFLPNQ